MVSKRKKNVFVFTVITSFTIKNLQTIIFTLLLLKFNVPIKKKITALQYVIKVI